MPHAIQCKRDRVFFLFNVDDDGLPQWFQLSCFQARYRAIPSRGALNWNSREESATSGTVSLLKWCLIKILENLSTKSHSEWACDCVHLRYTIRCSIKTRFFGATLLRYLPSIDGGVVHCVGHFTVLIRENGTDEEMCYCFKLLWKLRMHAYKTDFNILYVDFSFRDASLLWWRA